jgi:hypothetical protein
MPTIRSFHNLPLEKQVTTLAGTIDDLVEALERAIVGLLNPSSHPMAQHGRIKRARAAIAKARGAA